MWGGDCDREEIEFDGEKYEEGMGEDRWAWQGCQGIAVPDDPKGCMRDWSCATAPTGRNAEAA